MPALLCASAEAGGQLFVGFQIKRREHHFVPGLHPGAADRAADTARTDDADFHFAGYRGSGAHCHRQAAESERYCGSAGGLEKFAAGLPGGGVSFHGVSPLIIVDVPQRESAALDAQELLQKPVRIQCKAAFHAWQ
ncbi:MAG: hypothetical protein NTW47_01800 [Proteobacteria bacterium]|nr:hypothetical protein [Pseudomonadota bacterium]